MADYINRSAGHLASDNTLYEPARSNNFEFIVTDIEDLIEAGITENYATEEDFIENGQDIIRVSVISASVPHFSLDKIEIKRGNSTVKFAGVPSFSDGELKLNDYIGARTKNALMAWQALAYDVEEEKIFAASNYKKDCWLYEYTPDYSKVIRTWLLKGCWISNISEDAFSNENNGKREITATIVYDKAIMKKPDEEVTEVE